jgi:AcrR family transcriptional regulator
MNRRTNRRLSRKISRDEILDAAAQIFSQKGYHATSMQEIAQAVHLQKASLYYHVSSKQEILAALLDRALDMLIERLNRVVEQPLEPQEKLRLAMVSYLQALTDHRDLAAILLFEHRSLEPRLSKRHIPRRDRFEGLWRCILQEGREAGVFNSSNPALAARTILGVLNWTLTWYKPEGQLSGEAIANRYADLLLGGLLAR